MASIPTGRADFARSSRVVRERRRRRYGCRAASRFRPARASSASTTAGSGSAPTITRHTWPAISPPAPTASFSARLYGLSATTLGDRWHADLPGELALLPTVTTAGVLAGVSDGSASSLVLIGAGGAPMFSTVCAGCSFVSTPAAVGPDG